MTLLQEIENIVGTAGICLWEDTEAFWQKNIANAIAPGTKIDAIVYPNSQTELAEVIGLASRKGCGVLPMGGGSKLDWGGLVEGVNIAVSCDRINHLIDHAVGDLTVTLEAGMKFAQLQEILAKRGQFLPLDPSYAETATIGGIIATGDTGSWRQRYRGVRDCLLGITFVRADGKIAQAGGRVVKNVAGYDLMKLLTGSYGTLGIISQVTLRVYPLPEASTTVILTGEIANLIQAKQTLLSSALTPTALDLLSPQLAEKLGLDKGLALAVRFQNIATSVQEQSTRLLEVGNLLGLKGITYIDNDELSFWQRLKETIFKSVLDSTILCKIGVIPSAAVNILAELNLADALIHGGSGVGILRFDGATEMLLQVRRQCESQGGFLSILKAKSEIKQQLDVWGYQGNALNLMQQIKRQFDPENILSPHRFVGGI